MGATLLAESRPPVMRALIGGAGGLLAKTVLLAKASLRVRGQMATIPGGALRDGREKIGREIPAIANRNCALALVRGRGAAFL